MSSCAGAMLTCFACLPCAGAVLICSACLPCAGAMPTCSACLPCAGAVLVCPLLAFLRRGRANVPCVSSSRRGRGDLLAFAIMRASRANWLCVSSARGGRDGLSSLPLSLFVPPGRALASRRTGTARARLADAARWAPGQKRRLARAPKERPPTSADRCRRGKLRISQARPPPPLRGSGGRAVKRAGGRGHRHGRGCERGRAKPLSLRARTCRSRRPKGPHVHAPQACCHLRCGSRPK